MALGPSLIAVLLAPLQSAVPAGLPAGHGWKPELDPQVEISFPSWIDGRALRFVVDRRGAVLTAMSGPDAVKAWPIRPAGACDPATLACLGLRAPDAAELRAVLRDAAEAPLPLLDATAAFADRDGDGIADAVDVLLGARKTALLASPYVETARRLAYPGGDVPEDEGVCSDVIVRSLRNAGIDLQREIFEDAGRTPGAYRGITARNPSIDHRRVRNQVVWFERHWRRVSAQGPMLPGDVVFFDTFANRPGADHVGIVSDRTSDSGHPMVINSWTVGCRTTDMDLLRFVPVTAVYRAPPPRGATRADAFRLSADVKQAILVTTGSWTDAHASITAWQRDGSGRWRQVGRAIEGMLGGSGLGWGRGLHPAPLDTLGGAPKKEGDGRSPAGVFRAGALLGKAPAPPDGTRWPYRQSTARLRCVDDPQSPAYNRILEFPPGDEPPGELMLRPDDVYDLVLIIEHNGQPRPVPGAGSCIFLHPWLGPGQSSPGCTMARAGDVARLVRWLDPAANAVVVQLPRAVHRKLARAWDLPSP